MEMSPSQKESQIAASIPSLGEDVLLLRHMTAREEIGRLFEYELELLSEDHRIKLQDVLGHRLTVRLGMLDGDTRFFNGHVARFTYTGTHGEYARYRATVRPWLWFLTLTNDCRIFQDMTVPEIVEDTFRRRGFSDFKMNLTAEYRAREYATQYLETDFDFVSRLMENEGVFYYFEHEDGKHTVVVCDGDGISDHRPPTPGYEEVPYLAAEGTDHVTEHISDWVVSQQVSPGGVHLKDFNFRGPRSSLEAKIPVHGDLLADGVPSHSDLEIYDYPARYQDAEEAESYARIRMEEIEAQHEVADGRTNARGLAVGGTFEMVDHPRDEENREYVILSATFELYSGAYGTESTDEVKPTFRCDFKAMDTRRNYRLPRTTPRPVVQGPQTAIVVGPKGEKVWPDKYGRVKVHFHWDRHGQRDENSSCWIRVSQNWAGGTWGGMSIPHIGHEVVVEFLEGNPDRPLITGRVYNADNMPPLALPACKHKSIIRDDYGNEIVFDATPGNEHIWLHSPHHNSSLAIGNSVEYFSDSDSTEVSGGFSNEWTVGMSTSTTLGHASEFSIGSTVGVSVGMDLEAKLGVTTSLAADHTFDINLFDDRHLSLDDHLNEIGDIGLLDAKNILQFVAGENRHARIKMSDGETRIEYLPPTSRVHPPGTPGVITPAKLRSVKGQLVAIVVLISAASVAHAVAAPILAKQEEDEGTFDRSGSWDDGGVRQAGKEHKVRKLGYAVAGLHAAANIWAALLHAYLQAGGDVNEVQALTDGKTPESLITVGPGPAGSTPATSKVHLSTGANKIEVTPESITIDTSGSSKNIIIRSGPGSLTIDATSEVTMNTQLLKVSGKVEATNITA